MPVTSSNILNETHLQQITAAQSQLEEANRELALAERAGLTSNVAGQTLPELKAKVADLQSKLALVKNTYFPNAS